MLSGKFASTWHSSDTQVEAEKDEKITIFETKKTDYATVLFADVKKITDTNAPPAQEANMLGAAGDAAKKAALAA